MRVILLSYCAEEFPALQAACSRAGHTPVACVYARSTPPGRRTGPATRAEMDEDFYGGPVIGQRGGIPLDDEVTPERLWPQVDAAIGDLLGPALDAAAAGVPGERQDDAAALYASWMGPEFFVVDWSGTVRDIHNQVRTFRFGLPQARGPLAEVAGRWLTLLRTRTDPGPGTRVDCADGPIWIVDSVPAESPGH